MAEDVKDIGAVLPKGAQVYTYPVGDSYLAAAITSADLLGDGKTEAIVVYNERKPTPREGSLPLVLAVLARDGDRWRALATKPIVGGVLFSIRIDGSVNYLATSDVTGDGRPEVIVAPGTGASIGGWLLVLSWDGSKLTELARIGGHFFAVHAAGRGQPGNITAQSRYENEVRSYRWNGTSFREVPKPKL